MKATGFRRSWRIPYDDAPKPQTRRCDHPGCTGEGEYRAPKARDRLNDYYWFCLDHVRAYNSSWDFYKGMSPEQIEEEVRRSTTWQRDTWPLGAKTGNRRFNFGIHDPFGVFDEDMVKEQNAKARAETPEQAAMRVMELDGPLTLAILKKRYKELVKRHHPDKHGGDKAAEEKFKEINQAYTTLLASLNA
jgi:hypothetical protein